MKRFFERLGPGLMLAAAAVGVSHLVFATRAGATYGLSFVWLIVLISILKYPAFRFAVDYAGVTDRSLVHAYSKIGRGALFWAMFGLLVDLFIATTAVALVTAGLFISVFDLEFSGPHVGVALALVTAAILVNGHYRKAEFIVKVLVLTFTVLAICATLLALPELGSNGRGLFGAIDASRETTTFAISMAGWMPMPITGAIFISLWACEKKRTSTFDIGNARRDLNFGWLLTIVLAICFAIMGTAMLFETGRTAPASAGAFATELLSIFTAVVGDWSYPLIAAAAIAVMWSGVFALMDAVPRVISRVIDHMTNRGDDAPSRYSLLLVLQVAGVIVIMLFFMSNFGTFVAFATGTGFITAPALAYYNYKAITSQEVASQYVPSRKLLLWHWLGFAALAIFAVAFVLQQTIA